MTVDEVWTIDIILLGLILYFGGIIATLVTLILNLAGTAFFRKERSSENSFLYDFWFYLIFPAVVILGLGVCQIFPRVIQLH